MSLNLLNVKPCSEVLIFQWPPFLQSLFPFIVSSSEAFPFLRVVLIMASSIGLPFFKGFRRYGLFFRGRRAHGLFFGGFPFSRLFHSRYLLQMYPFIYGVLLFIAPCSRSPFSQFFSFMASSSYAFFLQGFFYSWSLIQRPLTSNVFPFYYFFLEFSSLQVCFYPWPIFSKLHFLGVLMLMASSSKAISFRGCAYSLVFEGEVVT